MSGQTLQRRSAEPQTQPPGPREVPRIPLILPVGTPIKVALDKDVRIHRTGQAIHGRTIEPLYAFDRLLVPANTEVRGRIAAIDDVAKKTRILAAMNADFSPIHKVHMAFDELVLPNGKQVRINTEVSPGVGVLEFVTAKEIKQSNAARTRATAKGKLSQARLGIKRQLETAKKEVIAPGKARRLERIALAESPYRPQYLDAGTSFNADLQQELSFGSEAVRPESVANVGTLPASGGVIRAWLMTPLSSSRSKKNDPVEAVLSQPLRIGSQLYLPEGTKLQGTVLQVRPARWFGRNGQLRITFHRVVLPDGPMREVEATLEGLEVTKGENLALDSEGGAQVKASKSRYLNTGIALALAASSTTPDEDNAGVHSGGLAGGPSGGAANGAMGFKLVGTLVGVLAHSQVVTAGLGAYGAAHSVYSHFLAHGRDVVYPKDMSMLLAIGDPKKIRTHPSGSRASGSQ